MPNSVIILFIIIGVAAVIAVIAFVIYKIIHPKMKDEAEKIDENQAAEEELKRVLVDVDDEETAKAISEYKDEDSDK